MRDPTLGHRDPTEDLSDEDLVRLTAVDREAFAQLYRRWAERLYRYCYRRLGTREAAEDITSQAMAQALANITSFRGTTFSSWLFTIARNLVASTFREPVHRLADSLEDDAELIDSSPGPEALALAGEQSQQLYAALAVLTPEQRQIVELRLADLTTAEIADVTGRSVDGVRMLQYRATRRLRAALATESGYSSLRDPKESNHV